MNPEQIIHQLQLKPHPEGGYYRETYRGESTFKLPHGVERNTSTAIYYLLADDDKSHLHKVASDELWFFHQGQALEILVIQDTGELTITTLGPDLEAGEVPQYLVRAGLWFAARVKGNRGFGLVSCVVSPGFDFEDFAMAKYEELIIAYPHLQDTLRAICKS